MSDYSLVPVDHQPDFSDASLVPVDHNPFSDDDAVQSAQGQPTQSQPVSAAGVGQPSAGALANRAQPPDVGESWNPETAGSDDARPNLSTAPTAPPGKVPFKPFDELKPATFTPTQQIGNLAADAGMALGMQPYTASDLATRIGNVLGGLTPLGVVGSALDLIDATHRGDIPGAVTAAAGLIPDARGVTRGVGEELHHAWPKYLGGAVKQELVPLAKSLHRQYHKALDGKVPKWRGKAYYDGLDPAEKQKAFQALVTETKKFDAEHGTTLYDALLKNGFPAP
jgi:hypothetical protein